MSERGRRAAILAVLVASGAAYSLLQSLVLPALPLLQREFGTSPSTIAWVATAYLLSASVATPLLGRVGDIVGKRAVLIGVLVLLAAGSVLAATTSSIAVLIAARVIQGAGGAIVPLAFGIVRDEFPPERIAASIGLISGIIGVFAGVGVAVAGPLVDLLSYHWLFWGPMLLIVPAAALVFVFVPASRGSGDGRINVRAALALSGWLVALLLGVAQGPVWGWSSPGVLALLLAAGALFAVWVYAEGRWEPPLVDVRMMRIPVVWWSNVAALLFGAGIYSMLVVVPPFLQAPLSTGYGLGESVTGSGLILLPSTFILLAVGLTIGPLLRVAGAKLPLIGGGLLGASAFVLLIVAHAGPLPFVVATSVVSIAVGLGFSALPYLILSAVPRGQSGVATGMNVNMRTIGGCIGTQLVVTVLAAGAAADGTPTESGYMWGFALVGAYFLLAAIACVALPAGRRLAADVVPLPTPAQFAPGAPTAVRTCARS
jgi:MFS family permease